MTDDTDYDLIDEQPKSQKLLELCEQSSDNVILIVGADGQFAVEHLMGLLNHPEYFKEHVIGTLLTETMNIVVGNPENLVQFNQIPDEINEFSKSINMLLEKGKNVFLVLHNNSEIVRAENIINSITMNEDTKGKLIILPSSPITDIAERTDLQITEDIGNLDLFRFTDAMVRLVYEVSGYIPPRELD